MPAPGTGNADEAMSKTNPIHIFTLLLDGPDVTEEPTISKLYEAGCDDALFGQRDSIQYGQFDREAPSLAEAVTSAISDVETVRGVRVLRVEPDDLVTATAIAERVGRSRESVRLLVEGKRGPGGFPSPIAWVDAKTRLWQWADVSRWFTDTLGQETPTVDEAEFLAALNAALELRNRVPHLKRKSERAAINRIVEAEPQLAVAARTRY